MEKHHSIISANGRTKIDWKEVYDYRDLFLFWILRDVKTRYAQSALGISWAIIQPLFFMVVFSIVFGNLSKMSSDNVPYVLFSCIGVIPWTYFSNTLVDSSNSLVVNANLLTKLYFPRILLPIAPGLFHLQI